MHISYYYIDNQTYGCISFWSFKRVCHRFLQGLCPRETDQFQKQECHPVVKTMPAAAEALFSDIHSQREESLTWLNPATRSWNIV